MVLKMHVAIESSLKLVNIYSVSFAFLLLDDRQYIFEAHLENLCYVVYTLLALLTG